MLVDSPMPALFMGVSIMVLLSLSPDFTWGKYNLYSWFRVFRFSGVLSVPTPDLFDDISGL